MKRVLFAITLVMGSAGLSLRRFNTEDTMDTKESLVLTLVSFVSFVLIRRSNEP